MFYTCALSLDEKPPAKQSLQSAASVFIIRTVIGFNTSETHKSWLNLSFGSASSISVCSPSPCCSEDLAKAVIEECSVIISVGLCYGPSVLDDCCLCCRPVGTSRTTGCVRTPARASCATTPTCTSLYPTRMESTTSGPPVSRAAHVRSSKKKKKTEKIFFFN